MARPIAGREGHHFAVISLNRALPARSMAHLMRRFALTAEAAALLASLIWTEGRE